MNINDHFRQLVAQTMSRRSCNHSEAWRITAAANPDAVKLLLVAGMTRQQVQFANAKIAKPNAAARRKFTEEVQAEMKSTHCNYGVAFNRVACRNPYFANSKDAAKASAPAIGADGVPVLTPELKSIYRLPADTTPTEWAAASKANSLRTMAEVHFGRVFDALCELTQQEKSLDYENALRETKSRFSDLWAACESLSMIPV